MPYKLSGGGLRDSQFMLVTDDFLYFPFASGWLTVSEQGGVQNPKEQGS